MLRQPIIALLGHVDHGKTSLLDKIRQTAIASKEAGGITQAIGITEIPSSTINNISGDILKRFNFELKVPGLLFIDTPGHEAFITLRKRGGSIADLAILVIDILEGMMPQTLESLNILKESKTPFIIAINKIDRIQGWVSNISFLENKENQTDDVQKRFEEAFYKIIMQLYNHNIQAERFDRIQDFTKTVTCVPTSGKTGEGIPELLVILIGLSQQYLKEEFLTGEHSEGMILEVREFTGIGVTIDCVLYSGSVHRGDYIVIGGKQPIIAKIRSLLVPEPLKDIRVEKKFHQVESVSAACGIKISAPGLSDVVAGSPIRTTKNFEEAEILLDQIEKERKEIEVVTEIEGIVLKSDTIGGLEALKNIFKKYPIKLATIGQITKRDITAAETNANMLHRVVIGFNIIASNEIAQYAKEKNLKIIESPVIYHLLEEYDKWEISEKEEMIRKELENVQRPAKILFLPGTIFRASNPAVIGCEVQSGIVKPGYKLFKASDFREIGEVKQIQSQGQNVIEAKIGDKVAISLPEPTVGRQINESDIFYTDLSSNEYKVLRKNEGILTEHEKQALNEICNIKRKQDSNWGL